MAIFIVVYFCFVLCSPGGETEGLTSTPIVDGLNEGAPNSTSQQPDTQPDTQQIRPRSASELLTPQSEHTTRDTLCTEANESLSVSSSSSSSSETRDRAASRHCLSDHPVNTQDLDQRNPGHCDSVRPSEGWDVPCTNLGPAFSAAQGSCDSSTPCGRPRRSQPQYSTSLLCDNHGNTAGGGGWEPVGDVRKKETNRDPAVLDPCQEQQYQIINSRDPVLAGTPNDPLTPKNLTVDQPFRSDSSTQLSQPHGALQPPAAGQHSSSNNGCGGDGTPAKSSTYSGLHQQQPPHRHSPAVSNRQPLNTSNLSPADDITSFVPLAGDLNDRRYLGAKLLEKNEIIKRIRRHSALASSSLASGSHDSFAGAQQEHSASSTSSSSLRSRQRTFSERGYGVTGHDNQFATGGQTETGAQPQAALSINTSGLFGQPPPLASPLASYQWAQPLTPTLQTPSPGSDISAVSGGSILPRYTCQVSLMYCFENVFVFSR